VLDKYVEIKKEHYPKSLFLDGMIRCVTNEASRVIYPYNTFKFNSLKDEITAKLLLMHPAIEELPDLEKVEEFYAANRLKHCAVQMNFNNPLHADIEKKVEAKREKYGPKSLEHYKNVAFNNVARKFYESRRMVEYFDLQTITLEEMCAISNFEERAIRFVGIERDEFETYGEPLLDLYRQDPKSRFKDKKFLIKPRFYLLCNYISLEQEELIITDYRTFYKKTNANEILRECQEDFSKNLDPSLTPEQVKKKARERFYLHYLRLPERNMPPFHDLYIIPDEEEEKVLNAKIAMEQTPSTSSGNSSNEPTIVENLDIPKIAMKQEEFNQLPDPSFSEMELITMLASSPCFLLISREAIKNQFMSVFDDLWTDDRKKLTFVHYVVHFVRKNPAPFKKLIESCVGEEMRGNSIKLFDELVAYHQRS
jgi:hypothetical protein